MTDGTVHAEARIRALLAALPPGTRNLGAEIVHDEAFRSGEWPRTAYALTRADLEAVLQLLDQTRTLRIARPSEAVDPAVHTPERIRAYLTAHGKPVCGCGHHRSFHKDGGRCTTQPYPCGCGQYVGPEPLPEYYAPELGS